jgi:tRNA-dihydrouridine synthase C
VARIVEAVRRTVPAGVPVTVKTRLGFDDPLLFEDIVRGIGDAGASELTVHARTRRQGYRPPAFWDEIAKAREWLAIPVIANGEIWSVEDALRCRASSGCPDLMLGRGALCRPDLAQLIRARDRGEDAPSMDWSDVLALVLRLLDLNLGHYDAAYAPNPIKQWLTYLRHYYPQAALLFENIKRQRDPAELRGQLAAALESAPSPRRSAA